MQIDEENIENMFVNMLLKKKTLKQTQIQKYIFWWLFIQEWAKKIKFENVQVMECKVILPKPTPMNHLHQNFDFSI